MNLTLRSRIVLRAAALLFVVGVVVLCLPGCGRDTPSGSAGGAGGGSAGGSGGGAAGGSGGGAAGGSGAGAAGGAPSGSGIPWRDGPSPDVREGLEHVPDLPGGTAEIVDLAVVRRAPKGLRLRGERAAADIRRFLVQTMGLPEEALGFGIHVERKEDGTSWTLFDAAKVAPDVLRKGAASRGFVEFKDSASGLTVWKHPDGEDPVAFETAGWVFSPPRVRSGEDRDPGTIDATLFATEKSVVKAQTGLLAALGAIPADALSRGSVEIAWGLGVSKDAFGPGVRPAALAEWKELSPIGAGIVLHFPTDEKRGYARKEMERIYAEALKKGTPIGFVEFEERGAFLRLLARPGENMDEALGEQVRSDLRALREALRSFREETGRLPTAEEGLAILATMPRLLDDFVGLVPRDAWDRPYHYRPPANEDGEPDLRSLGADGKVDTPDDVKVED